MTITATQLLDIGTPVQVGIRRGKVTKAKLVNAHNGGMVALHTVKFTEYFVRGFGCHGTWVKMPKAKMQQVNYSFIQVLPA